MAWEDIEVYTLSSGNSWGHPTKVVSDRADRYDTPNYWSIPKSQLAPLPYERDISRRLTPTGRVWWYQNRRYYTGLWSGWHLPYGGTEGYDTAYNWCASAYGDITGAVWPSLSLPQHEQLMLGKIDEGRVNLAMAFAERQETWKLMRDRCLQLVNAVRAVRRGRFDQASEFLGFKIPQRARKRLRRNRLDQFAENWLEFRYGWTPLYYDVFNAMNAGMRDLQKNNYFVIETSAKAEVKATFSDPAFVGNPPISGRRWFDMNPEGTRTETRRIGVMFELVDLDTFASVASGLQNPMLIAWELIPFSFVVDWFTPISDSLSSLSAYDGLRVHHGWKSTKVETTVTCSGYTKYDNMNTSPQLKETFEGTYEQYDMNFKRSLITDVSQLQVYPWDTSNGLNAKRALDAVTLLQGVYKGALNRGDQPFSKRFKS